MTQASSAPLGFDGSLPRRLAGSGFRRADAARDERAAPRETSLDRAWQRLRAQFSVQRAGLRRVERLHQWVRAAGAGLSTLDDAALRQRFSAAVQGPAFQLAQAMRSDAALAPVLACVGEACRRLFGFAPHGVQYLGAQVLLQGRLAEMNTGEGKTLVAAIAATVMAATGAAVHVVSTNDYLAQRDSEEMGPLFRYFGLGCACVKGGMEPAERRQGYAHAVCYVAGKELVFDFLKDRLAGHGLLPVRVSLLHALASDADSTAAPLIPAMHFAIVDEADSVLIDEARTPMILSRQAPGLHPQALLSWAIDNARALQPGLHYRIGARRRIDLMPAALSTSTPLPEGLAPMWQSRAWREMILQQALTALHLFHRDQHYLVTEGKVQIVDESTGRVMADRAWEQGLHQLIEVKEGLASTDGRESLARMSFQRFFRRYYLLGGLTGTAAEAARELRAVYLLPVTRLPPNRPSQRRRLTDSAWPDDAARWRAVVADALAARLRGQPVLVGTRSVEASERVAAEFCALGVPHVLLNARQDAAEACIVAAAGEAGRLTIATNMAGRGTDIKLSAAARAAGGLHVILTDFHESPRVDRQLFGRSGRQGDAGSALSRAGCSVR
jgi:preprotein translocase subunit SecA